MIVISLDVRDDIMLCSQNAVISLFVWTLAASALAQPLPSAAPMLADAELTSVCFVDADHGWAVGDRGVILATSDGGRNWQLQRSPTSCRLESVQFLDTLHGWAVGGFTRPYTHHTSGVVLRTRDGGRTWQAIPDRTLPALRHVVFTDVRHGWAAGEASPLYSSGIFKTTDGGKEWAPVPKGTTRGWTAADFADVKSGALIDRGGRACLATPASVRSAQTANVGSRPVHRLRLAGGGAGWLVGDGGLLLTTRDGGHAWTAPTAMPPGASQFDYAALAIHKQHCWIAGNPGTCVFHSADGGATWDTFRTEQRLPLRDICFIDENRGWAVGSLGTILATRDGGQSWRVQRSGGSRAALLAIFSKAERLPLAVFAQQSASEGYLGVAEVLGRPAGAADDPRLVSLAERTHEAVTAAGGSHASQSWRFPLPPGGVALTPQAVMDHWNAATGGQAASQLEEHLVRRIRTWRPEVIITENVSPRGEDPLAHVTSQVVLAAVEKAQDAAAYPQQLSQQGLEPWKVKKVFGVQADSRQGTVNVAPPAWSPRLARSLADVAEAGRALIVAEPQPLPSSIGLSLLVDHLPQNTGRRDIFSGLVLLAGGEARREPLAPPAGDLEQFARAAQKRHNVEQLLARVGKDSSQGAAMLAQINELTEGIGDRGAGEILLALARRYHEAGKSAAAAETLELLLDRYGQHPLVDSAAIWLVQYYSSGELALRERQRSRTIVQTTATADLAAGDQPPAVTPAGFDGSDAGNQNSKPDNERAGKALAVGRLIERTRPVLAVDPRLHFPLLSAHQMLGQTKEAEQLFASLASRAGSDPWGLCATAEQCLLQKTGVPPKTIVSCVSTTQRPKLDGRLDGDLWQAARSVSLAGSAGDRQLPAAAVALAFDQQFLYVAISCQKAAGGDYQPDDSPRSHDADLTARDRVEIHLDIDRDYASYWTLAVDCRGFTRDSVFGDATWNPTWFVARGGDERYWSAEIAIPLAELCPLPPQPRDAWAVGIQRIIPNVGFQSATQPASTIVRPEGFGLLMFE